MRHTVRLGGAADFAGWRDAARDLLLGGIPPQEVDWRAGDAGASLLEENTAPPPPVMPPPRVPPAFLELAEAVICHSDPARFGLLYRLIARLQAERHLLSDAMDADVVAARRLEKAVRRDAHKMTAFVRFREAPQAEGARRRFIAWFEPEHHIVAHTAPFFARRFGDMDWMILTPRGSASLTDGTLSVSEEPARKPDLADPTDELWLTYYANIFNPARLKVKAMLSEMPKKYWANLPEAALIPDLIAQTPARVAAMAEQEMRRPPLFHERLQARATAEPTSTAEGLAGLREEARSCTRCPLHCHATQTVFGEGPDRAELMIVGEQPGDHEDLQGRPFVGPAGQVFDEAMRHAGIDRGTAYVTNAVKHFKYELRGKRRLHQSPNSAEVEQCRWWLGQEMALVRPRLVVAMGRTAVLALTGRAQKLADLRGRVQALPAGPAMLATVHPSYLLRLPDARAREQETIRFREDLAAARNWLSAPTSSPAR
ncbi:UdgX family uracil-DNA binding protein [Roseococcus pinisoli]|uniref:Type-4 uracil-DNA glycosylase n=1 Tax=Roseococcus pinisoli TaxID=2835040 RepID=A0ABS5QEH4_9PROT|nr:UdgX family uracil-DNA binding protein [Roseococcus pinisoli]